MPDKKPTANVMGGSLGGLMAALWLQHAGYDVSVFERSGTSLSARGAGIALHPETMRLFKERGSIDVNEISVKLETMVYLRSPPEPPLHPVPISVRVASYNSLMAALRHCFPDESYHLSHEVVGISQTQDSVTVSTSNGASFNSDLLVCADGTESSARSMLLDSEEKVQYAGYVAWRGIVAKELLSDKAMAILEKSLMVHMTKDGHIISYPIPMVSNDLKTKRLFINWIWYRNTPSSTQLDTLMIDSNGRRRARSVPPGLMQPHLVKQFKDNLSNISEIAAELCRVTKMPFIQAVYDHESPQITFGRACLLGDAAFSVRPHTAVGTAKAAEDARQLALALERNGNDVKKALREYGARQGALGRFCVERSRRLGIKLQSGDWEVGQELAIGLFKAGDSQMD